MSVARLEHIPGFNIDRVAPRAAIEVLDRVLGRPKSARSAPERNFALEAESARDKLAKLLDRAAAARPVTA